MKKGLIIVWVSFTVNILLFGIKIWAGHKTNSIVLLADGWHTLSDCISTIVVMVGIKWSLKPADREHPFGHGRAETIAAIFVGFFLITVAFEFGREAVIRLNRHIGAVYGITGVIVMSVSVIMKEGMCQLSVRTGKKIKSDALVADGWHHRSDAISSMIILMGILFNSSLWWMDATLTGLLAIYLIYVAYKIIRNAINPLLGEAVEEYLVDEIKMIGKEIYGKCLHMHHFNIHKYGRHTEMTLHIVLPEKKSLKETAEITKKLFTAIKEKTGIVVTIHVDADSKYKKENL